MTETESTNTPAAAPSERVRRFRIAAWCMYDWANSGYAAIVLSFVFAPYFLEHVARDDVRGTVLWSWAITASAIAIGLLSPIVGAFCDKGGQRRLWLFMFSALAIVATAAMWGVAPDPAFTVMALVLLAVSNTGFELAYVFYNAMLPEVAAPRQLGRISGWAWGLGYIGALAAMGLAYTFLVSPDPPLFGLDPEMQEGIRATAPFAALWFLVFAMPLILYGPPDPPTGLGAKRVIRDGLRELCGTIKGLPRTPPIAWYLGAHMIYIDGINTLIVFGPLYAAGSFDFSANEVLLYGITFFIAAGIGSFVLGWFDDRFGSKPVVSVSLISVLIVIVTTVFVRDAAAFWGLSMVIAFFLGPVQASSRSLMARLAPEDTRTQLFGLYALAGRATGPLGPALLGWIVATTGNQRAGVAVIGTQMLVGTLMLAMVREPRSAKAPEGPSEETS